LRTESGANDLGISAVLVGRIAAIIFMICGVLGLCGLVLPVGVGANPTAVIVVASVAVSLGVIAWVLPWNTWPRWCTHCSSLSGLS